MYVEPTRLTDDLFSTSLPEGGVLIFSPIRGVVLGVTQDEFTLISPALQGDEFGPKPEDTLAKRLYDAGYLPPEVESAWGFQPVIRKWITPSRDHEPKEFLETQITSMTLNLTSLCNLGCSYCHSNLEGRSVKMPKDILDGALLLLRTTALATGRPVHITLLGEGENLVVPDLVKHVCERVVDMQAEGLRIDLGVVTNATLITDENMTWMAAAVDHFSISWDGDQAAMDTQRTAKGGGSIYARMLESFEILRNHQVNFGLRMTATAHSIGRLPEFVRLASETIYKGGRGSLMVEPQAAMGKGDEIHQPDITIFNQMFWEAKEVGKSLGIRVTSGLLGNSGVRMTYCGTGLPMVVVAPDGNITACSRVSKSSDPSWDYFKFGYFDPIEQKFIFNHDQIKKFRNLQPDNYEECAQCCFKYRCSGGCYALRDVGKQSYTCSLTKVLNMENLVRSHRKKVEKDEAREARKISRNKH